jgi:uncharacterized protein (DUF1697 family)
VAKYVAFLRAINVGGHVVKMDQLRELFSGLKFSNVETFIASGNVIFDTKSAPDQKLEQKIEKHLEKALGYEVGTFVRSIEEIHAISIYEPFSSEAVKAAHVVSVGFLRDALSDRVVEQVMTFRSDVDDFHVHGRGVLAVPGLADGNEGQREEVRARHCRSGDVAQHEYDRAAGQKV